MLKSIFWNAQIHLNLAEDEHSIYLLHYPKPFKGKNHYLGICKSNRIEQRLTEHAMGYGSRITHHLSKANEKLFLARIWHHADFNMEAKMKKASHYDRLCPCCTATNDFIPPAEVTWESWKSKADAGERLRVATSF